jgi:hypothetical protein
MKPDRTASQRQSRARQALAESGGRTITVKIGPEAAAVLARMRETMTVREAIEAALSRCAPSAPAASTPGRAD